jgi:hypothetical protein
MDEELACSAKIDATVVQTSHVVAPSTQTVEKSARKTKVFELIAKNPDYLPIKRKTRNPNLYVMDEDQLDDDLGEEWKE